MGIAKTLMFLNPRKRHKKRARRSTIRRRRRTSRSVRVMANPSRKRRTYRRRRGGSRRRSVSRRRRYRNPSSGGGMGGLSLSGIKGVLNKDNLMLAGGFIAGSTMMNWINIHWSSKATVADTSAGAATGATKTVTVLGGGLPGMSTSPTVMGYVYSVGVPVLAGLVLRRFSPSLAKGLVISGITNGLNNVLNPAMQSLLQTAVPATAATAGYVGGARAYLPRSNGNAVQPMGAYSTRRPFSAAFASK